MPEESLAAARKRLTEGKEALDKTQKDKIRAASDLLKRLSVSSLPFIPPKRSTDPDSLPSSPVSVTPSVKSAIIEDAPIQAGRRLSLSEMLQSVRANLDTKLVKRASVRAPVSPISSEEENKEPEKDKFEIPPVLISPPAPPVISPGIMLKRGQGAHRIFQVLNRLDIPNDNYLKRMALCGLRKEKIPSAREISKKLLINLLLTIPIKKLSFLMISAIERWQLYHKDPIPDKNKSAYITKRQSPFQAAIGLGRLCFILEKKFRVLTSPFYTNLRKSKKKQLEIAFLRAALAEVLRRENDD